MSPIGLQDTGANHLAVVNLRNQMREIRNSIFEELKRLGETYKSDYAIAKQREVGVQQELAQAVSGSQATDAKSVTLRELQSTAQTYKTIYDNFLQRYMEAVQQQSFPITEARLISSASRPLSKSHPQILLVLAFVTFGGIILGAGIGLLRHLSDRVFRTSEQVESLLQTSCLALLPFVTSDDEMANELADRNANGLKTSARGQNKSRTIAKSLFFCVGEAIRSFALVSDLHGTIRSSKRKISSFTSSLSDEGKSTKGPASPEPLALSKAAGPRTIVRTDSGPIWAVVNAPISRFAEAMRSIKLGVDLHGVVKSNKIIGFTSSIPNEGKSTVAAALAQLISQVGNARVILVDCDLRNPSISRELAPGAKFGILEVLAQKASLEETMWIEPASKMAFLPAVVRSRLPHSNEILSSVQMKNLFEQLRQSYDYVIVDLPPLAPIVDVRAMTHLADSFVFVIEWGQTKIDIVEQALDGAPGVNENLAGVVLNKVDMNVFGRYASHRESYYYNKYYSRYGYRE